MLIMKNNFIAFTLGLFYDEMRSVLKSFVKGVLFLYRKAPGDQVL